MGLRKREISDIVGETIDGLRVRYSSYDMPSGAYDENEIIEVYFETESGRTFKMYHDQDCCEDVRLIDVAGGELHDLLGEKILKAYKSSVSNDDPDPYSDSETWTFYVIVTNKVSLCLRWLGESNGYYSEEVSFVEEM